MIPDEYHLRLLKVVEKLSEIVKAQGERLKQLEEQVKRNGNQRHSS